MTAGSAHQASSLRTRKGGGRMSPINTLSKVTGHKINSQISSSPQMTSGLRNKGDNFRQKGSGPTWSRDGKELGGAEMGRKL